MEERGCSMKPSLCSLCISRRVLLVSYFYVSIIQNVSIPWHSPNTHGEIKGKMTYCVYSYLLASVFFFLSGLTSGVVPHHQRVLSTCGLWGLYNRCQDKVAHIVHYIGNYSLITLIKRLSNTTYLNTWCQKKNILSVISDDKHPGIQWGI